MASIHRATLLSFDAATYAAMVLIEGADNEAQIPVSQWLPPALLVPNVEAAVVLFDPTNTDDGLLIAVYGSVDNWTIPALNLGSATGAAAGELALSGAVRQGNNFSAGFEANTLAANGTLGLGNFRGLVLVSNANDNTSALVLVTASGGAVLVSSLGTAPALTDTGTALAIFYNAPNWTIRNRYGVAKIVRVQVFAN